MAYPDPECVLKIAIRFRIQIFQNSPSGSRGPKGYNPDPKHSVSCCIEIIKVLLFVCRRFNFNGAKALTTLFTHITDVFILYV